MKQQAGFLQQLSLANARITRQENVIFTLTLHKATYPVTDYKRYRKYLIAVVLCLGLAGCGGGGGATIEEPPPTITDNDNDGVENSTDNCPDDANADQTDNDSDGTGDACDADDDNDNVDDVSDNCSLIANTNQANNDGDTEGDVCDADDDNDNVDDAGDNCPLTSNANQANNDGDADGDVCDPDDDNDSIDDANDNCPFTANTNQQDSDMDNIGDACDSVAGTSPPETIRLPVFRSAITNDAYSMSVFLPENYNPNFAYPVMYIMDDITPRLAVFVNGGKKQVILVSVATGDRERDFTSPGVATFFDIFTTEILPYIEAEYLVNANQRSVVGFSFAGLFTGLALLMEDPNDRKFKNYVAFDGSFWNDPSYWEAREQQLANITNTVPANLYLSGATAGASGNDSFVRNFRDSLQARNFNQLNIDYVQYNTGHGGTIDPYGERVINLIFP